MKEAEPVFFNAEWGELTTDLRRSSCPGSWRTNRNGEKHKNYCGYNQKNPLRGAILNHVRCLSKIKHSP